MAQEIDCPECGACRWIQIDVYGDKSCQTCGHRLVVASSPTTVSEAESRQQCAQDMASIRERRRGEEARRVVVAPTWYGVGPEPPRFTREHAMGGEAGKDYYPRDACSVCGGIPWWNGRRVVEHHDAAKHHVYDEAQRMHSAQRGGPVSAPDLDRLAANQRARRSQGEHDE